MLRQFDKNTLRAVKTYIYHNRELDISTISETVGSKRTLVCQDTTILYHGKATNAYCVLRILNTDAVNQTKMGSLLKLYDGTFMLPETAYKLFRVTNVNLNTIGVLNTLWCAHKQGAEIHHIFDSLYEFTCPECGRKLLLTSDEIFSFKHSNEFCVGKEII